MISLHLTFEEQYWWCVNPWNLRIMFGHSYDLPVYLPLTIQCWILFLLSQCEHNNHLEIVIPEFEQYRLLLLIATWEIRILQGQYRSFPLHHHTRWHTIYVNQHNTSIMPYLYFVTKQCRNTAICALVNSVPTQNLMPPPKAMKCFEAPFSSCPCIPPFFH